MARHVATATDAPTRRKKKKKTSPASWIASHQIPSRFCLPGRKVLHRQTIMWILFGFISAFFFSTSTHDGAITVSPLRMVCLTALHTDFKLFVLRAWASLSC